VAPPVGINDVRHHLIARAAAGTRRSTATPSPLHFARSPATPGHPLPPVARYPRSPATPGRPLPPVARYPRSPATPGRPLPRSPAATSSLSQPGCDGAPSAPPASRVQRSTAPSPPSVRPLSTSQPTPPSRTPAAQSSPKPGPAQREKAPPRQAPSPHKHLQRAYVAKPESRTHVLHVVQARTPVKRIG
jgi:hypothetical protein